MNTTSKNALVSDEAIIAALTHEFYELDRLRSVFAEGRGYMNVDQFINEINKNNPGNFHDLAWEHADLIIVQIRMRKSQ